MNDIATSLVVIWLVSANVVAWVLYGLDKARARRGEWRVRESHLLAAALVGGSAGAALAMWMFHHKTSKQSFRWRFLGVIALQVAMVLAWRVART